MIRVLSNRADLISGGEALVEVIPAATHVDIDGRDVTSMFALRPNGRYMGLVTGMPNGVNNLRATIADGSGAVIRITNHPIGGPVFSGPQILPWDCGAGAVDAQCNRPATYAFFYKNTATNNFQSYDPSNPPAAPLIASTTTDQGKTVPYIIRQESGIEDRNEYAIAVLFDPTKPWTPWAPQPAWNGKMLYNGGASCGFVHGEGAPPSVQVDSALSRGFAVASTTLDNNGQNCNLVVQAESIMMAKEHFVDHYGEIRYTIGNGCSGGSIFQQQDENAYPGLLDGLQPMCSFPDDWTTAMNPTDCHLLLNYWKTATGWTAQQQADVAGDSTISVCQSWVNVYQYSQGGNPSNTNYAISPCWANSNVTADARQYNASSNPGGVRCTLQDYMVDVLGQRPPSVWSDNEKKIGHGFANVPYSNVGVQYGLSALASGSISPTQFADLNAKVGGLDIDFNFIAPRTGGDPQGFINAYHARLVNEGTSLKNVPIIDLRGHDDSEIHSDFRSYVMRARLDKYNGTHGNQIVWTGPAALVGDTKFTDQALTLIDTWLKGMAADTATPSAVSVLKDKPAAAVDACFDGNGDQLPSGCSTLYPYYGSPRIASGEPFQDDVLKCQLKPLNRADYTVTFSDADWAQLQAAFPTGVCDYSKPGQYQVAGAAWNDFSNGPGGQPMGDPPVSQPLTASTTTLPNTSAAVPVGAAAVLGLALLPLLAWRRRPS